MSSAVADSSPLIALAEIGELSLLEKLYRSLFIPPAVAREIAPTVSLPAWINERALAQPMASQVLRASLGPGEREAISLALELRAERVILDERPARRLAQGLGLPVIGTLGILLAAKRKAFIPVIRPRLEALLKAGFRMAPDLYKQAVAAAGEDEEPKRSVE